MFRLEVKLSYVSSRNGFFEACLTLKTATLSFRPLNEACARISLKALVRESGDVSVGKVSIVALSVWERRVEARVLRLSGLRARRATARFPCEGWARIRARPAPWAGQLVCGMVGGGCCGLTVDGPAPMRIARPVGAMIRSCWSSVEDVQRI